jgi:arsenate reductase (glutaredoxin)
MNVTVWHHTGCGSSRNAVAYLESKGIKPSLYLYLKEKPDAQKILSVLEHLGLEAAELLRPNQDIGVQLGVYDAGVSQEKILAAMVENPILIQRPIVITDKGAVIARPKTEIDRILES